MYKSAKKGWYELINHEKFIVPTSESASVMKSYDNGKVQYKSGLELKAIRYCDYNKHIVKFSLEPFAIQYIKPTDGKVHRYFVDLFIEFSTGQKFLVEIKSSSETKEPRKPSKKTSKAIDNYNNKVLTFAVNKAKWLAAEQFANSKGLKFIILTEEELG